MHYEIPRLHSGLQCHFITPQSFIQQKCITKYINIHDFYCDSARVIIEQIIQEGAISHANLRLLVDSIVISEKDKKLHIKINLNAKFERHKNCYDEEGNLTESVFIA